ncbi:MAG: putative manganese transport protein [Rhodospirillales bacterium]|nr:putative manganese transport protein [Rhodospirillales bacterium]
MALIEEKAAAIPAPRGKKSKFLRSLGPGLISGAADDDPSGIGTYSQAGAQLGFGISWTMLLAYPLMVAIQEISALIGRTTGHGIAGNIRRHYSGSLLHVIVALLFIANAINIGADLAAMADALKMLIGGPLLLYVVLFGVACVVAQIVMRYPLYVSILKWTTLSLFAYVAALLAIKVPWGEALHGLLVPHIELSSTFATTLVALLGTTISPYLFFWQASQEAEDERIDPDESPLLDAPEQGPEAIRRIRCDTLVGMAFSNVIAIAIMITTAATLHANGVTDIETSSQAAEALRPIAGNFAFVIFALGIIGTGMLAVPVLAGSSAYAVGEMLRWRVGLARLAKDAPAFYGVLAVATLVGIGLNMTPIDPIKALYWSAVVNGVVAVPVMVITMMMVANRKVMGDFRVHGGLWALGWVSTGAMGLCVLGMVATWIF